MKLSNVIFAVPTEYYCTHDAHTYMVCFDVFLPSPKEKAEGCEKTIRLPRSLPPNNS